MKRIPLLSLLLCWNGLQAQDLYFNQYLKSAVYTNPAFCGSATGEDGRAAGRLTSLYRNQWGRDAAYRSTFFSFDQRINGQAGALGGYVIHDAAGPTGYRSTQINAVYSYNLPLNHRNQTLQFGFTTGYRSQGIALARLRFEDQIDYSKGVVRPSAEPLRVDQVENIDLGAGVALYTEKFQLGLAMHNITRPLFDYTGILDNRIPRRYTLHGGYNLRLPTADRRDYAACRFKAVAVRQGPFSQFNASTELVRNGFGFSLGYRRNWYRISQADALILHAQAAHKEYVFFYSFENTVSSLRNSIPATHEIGLQIRFRPIRYSPRPEGPGMFE